MKAPCGQADCDCGHTIDRLKEYAQHKSGCERYSSTVYDTPAGKGVRAPGDCTCGLDALLSARDHHTFCRWYPALGKWDCHPNCSTLSAEREAVQ